MITGIVAGAPVAPPPAGVTDPHFASVSVLCGMAGADGSTTFTDEGPLGLVLSATGNAQVDTGQFKFGGSSLITDGNNDYLTAASNAALNFGTGDYTVEFWARPAIGSTVNFASWSSSNQAAIYQISSNVRLFYSGADKIAGAGADFTVDNWHHVAVTRESGTHRLFVNGNLKGSSAVAVTFDQSTFQLGRFVGSASMFNGHFDELRVTKGVARYTASFTPPTEEFPRS